MKIAHGVLIAGASVCALALGGCSSSEQAAFANAILASGAVNTTTGKVTDVSDASSDTRTSGSVTIDAGDDEELFTADDTASVSVANGGQVAGPKNFVYDDDDSQLGSSKSAELNDAGFFVYEPDPASEDEQSILVAAAGLGGLSVAGFVGANSTTTGNGNVAAGFAGVAPDPETMPTGTVEYEGIAATVVQEEGEYPAFFGGTSAVTADFSNGSVYGTFDFDENEGPTLGFAGTMSTDKATYSANSVVYNGGPATGQVQAGFYGTDYSQTAGAFDIQEAGGGPKAIGSFIAAVPETP